MAKIGVLKPFRGTYSELKDIVLEEREIVFEIPSTGVGTGQGAIKMGDGVRAYKDLPYFLGTKTGGYSSGTTEEDLINNLNYISDETIGKIYYIQSHYNGGTTTENNAIVGDAVPYKVIGKNMEGTTNTIDIQAMVTVNYLKHWANYNTTWYYNSTDPIFTYLADGGAYQSSLSSNIQACLQTMTERWRTDNGNTDSGTTGSSPASTRYTKSKLLNPYELFGSFATSDLKADFTSTNYGQFYSSAFNATSPDTALIRYYDLAMSNAAIWWTNSFRYVHSSGYHLLFLIDASGRWSYHYPTHVYGVCPCLRLKKS